MTFAIIFIASILGVIFGIALLPLLDRILDRRGF